MKKGVKEFLAENSFFVFILCLACAGMWIYASTASSNVPIMDYWRYLVVLVDKSYMGGLSFNDIYTNNGVHRSPLDISLFLLNIKLFHWNTQIAMYLSVFLLLIASIVVLRELKRLSGNNMLFIVLGVLSVLIIFSLAPYELISQEFAFSSAVRLLCYLHICILTNRLLKSFGDQYKKENWLVCLYYLFMIDIIGGAFSIGLAIALIMVILFDYQLKRARKIVVTSKNYIVLIFGILLGMFFYLYNLDVSSGTETSDIGLLQTIFMFFKGLCIVCGSSILGEYTPTVMIIGLGVVVLVVHVLSLALYLYKKMYDETYVPGIMYAYSCGFYGMIFMGRSGYGIGYLSASRYTRDASYALIADIIVIILLFKHEFKEIRVKRAINVYAVLVIIMFYLGIASIDAKEMYIAHHRKDYCNELITMMQDLSSYSDEELGAFQANNPQQVRDGVEIMKKYKLGIFHYLD